MGAFSKHPKAAVIAILLLSCICSIFVETSIQSAFANTVEIETFDEYVRKERRREILEGEESNSDTESSAILEEKARAQIIGNFASIILAVIWVILICVAKKKYFEPYNVSDMKQVNKCGDKELEALVFSMTPLQISAIINLNKFTIFDLLSTFFDLIRRNKIKITGMDIEGKTEFRAVQTDDGAVSNYEDFLIKWFVDKIGENMYFSLLKLKQYFELDSGAAQFDIDYDIWNDEINECANEMHILDEQTEKCKLYCTVCGVIYGVFGLVLIYLTNSALTLLLFIITYLCYRLSNYKSRRTKDYEVIYEKILDFRKVMEEDLKKSSGNLDECKLEKYFVYSIPLENTELVFSVYDKYEQFYKDMERELSAAITFASNIINEAVQDDPIRLR